jgi:flagellar basal body-associated protein FliL
MNTKQNVIDEQTNVRSSLRTVIISLILLIGFIAGAVMGYSKIMAKIDTVDNKVDKAEFTQYKYQYSLRSEYQFKAIQHDLNKILKKLNIEE